MPFSKTTILSTKESAFGSRQLGQLVACPTGRLDKVAVYLEPEVLDSSVAETISVYLEAYATDGNGLPMGVPLAQDWKKLSDIKIKGFANFKLETDAPSVVAVVLRLVGGDPENFVSWRYESTPSSGQELLVSEDAGASWTQDSSKKFAYIAYSKIANVVDADLQQATIMPGVPAVVADDTAAEFSLAKLDRAMIQGDTVAIEFGDVVVTMVVDQSGSMTWNDHEGLRFEFLNKYIDDLEAVLPAGSEASYSIVKFRSRQIGRISISAQEDFDETSIAGVRVVRKIGSPPSGPFDPMNVVVFEGIGEMAVDVNLTAGVPYFYGAYTFDGLGNFSPAGRFDYAQPSTSPKPPMGVASLRAVEQKILVSGNDVGKREIKLSWTNPAGYDYTTVTLVRRTDRHPESPVDGDVILSSAPASTTTFTDFDITEDAVNGLTYYYAMFTEKAGLKCYASNARRAQVEVSIVDRVWEKAEPPFNVPPVGFDNTPPGAPAATLTPGNGRILLEWVPADADSKRYKVYYGAEGYPLPKTQDSGPQEYEGELIYDGTDLSFLHSELENGEPHFYVILALDAVGNQSTAVMPPVTRPRAGLTTVIPTEPVSGLSAEVVNSTTNQIAWKFPFSGKAAVEGWYGDVFRIIGNVTYADTDPSASSATFEFDEKNRTAVAIDDGEISESVKESILDVATTPAPGVSTITSTVSASPFLSVQNQVKEASVALNAALRVNNRASGKLIREVLTKDISIKLKHPLEIMIENNPEQTVNRVSFLGACNEDASPEIKTEQFPGVYVRTGEPFRVTLTASFRGEALETDINLSVRILDKETGDPSSLVRLPETNAAGVALFPTQFTTDEVVDRTGIPTGDTKDVTTVDIEIPPQSVPGDYILEVSGEYQGYVRTTKLEFHFESSLNVDVDAIIPPTDGVSKAEQKAFVYFGDPTWPTEQKAPVPDQTITEWSLVLLGGNPKSSRPFFSTDGVPGVGVKAATKSGIAKNVFFGPVSEVEAPTLPTCTDGEMYALVVKAKAGGLTGTGYALLELTPFEPFDMNRLFVRLAADQPTGNYSGRLTGDLRFADGEDTSRWEVVAKPELDGDISDENSGKYMVDKIVNPPISGLVPSLPDGAIVTGYLRVKSGSVRTRNISLVTNLTGPKGTTGFAKARVDGGRAVFDVKLNAKVVGEFDDPPLTGEAPSNPVYNSDSIVWQKSPLVLSLTVFTVVEVNGKPVVFSGGGSKIDFHTPPAFISYQEPLA
jgi:hypothetical protein